MKENPSSEKKTKLSGDFKLVIPFFVVLGLLTVVSFIIPLRPAASSMEKRELASFPEFSWEDLVSGSYFDDITLWFSDTFPGREQWLTLSSDIASLHGHSEIAIAGDLSISDPVPPETEPCSPVPQSTEAPEADPSDPASREETEETAPVETGWGGVDAGAAEEINLGAVIQIGDAAFNFVGYSQLNSDRYAESLSKLADRVADQGVRVVSAPCPTSVGIMIQGEYLEALRCARQDETIGYLHDHMSSNVTKVDTFSALIGHNSEYIYFRTDHHWTALGAYYSYRAICEALDMEPAPLDSFQVWPQGEFEGSIYWKCQYPKKLRLDTVDAYIPQGDITHMVYDNNGNGSEFPLLADATEYKINSKYLTFLCSDHPLSQITNESIPDAPNCILIKDSFGNCLAPFLTQNYHNVYAIDYRKFSRGTLAYLIGHWDISDVIFSPYLTATQSEKGNRFIRQLCS